MKELTCCFTGHRKIPPKQYSAISRQLKNILIELIEKGFRFFLAGGALGFDTLAGNLVTELKKQYTQIRLILVLPCKSQANRWKDSDIAVYQSLKENSDAIIYTSENYTRECFFLRNRYMVDHSSLCICYQTQAKGGTCYTVQYAHKQHVDIINVVQFL